ncbi:alpha/beta fold hydrolase [Paraburkholderia fynbosensis]|uniref:2-succinyl-6-hydroxy-2, 4-cyclohexadiene-1-carboxylate synthase n=1 Tax=Paraburkholderia fynbosensis TaxID=1200993 RepID=A0A6J5FTK5_9BURK|nr:alpha/beta hydrolase [Paraburkholderia fynbosensis]CAB3787074.1 2-succinyl-6-hydroxy-2, 4-cyclohexadiene-1-carboxylate synthase [Paraburkholderia fynbosensis]
MTLQLEAFIQSGPVRLAVQDHGGIGPVMLLLHGAGRSAADWLPMAHLLTSNRHVIALDLRGHGLSGSGDWNVDLVLKDIRAVLQSYSTTNISIAGHSLGGVLAFLYASRYGGVSQVIDLDGFALLATEYVGLSPEEAAASQERVRAEWVRPQPNLTDKAVAKLEENLIEAYGLSPADSSEIVRRALKPLGNQSHSLHTDMRAIQGIRALYGAFLHDDSFFDLIRSIDAPTLILRANRLSLPAQLPEWHKEMLKAYFLGVQHQTDALQYSNQFSLSVRESSHMMMLEEPVALAAEISRFLTAG